MVSLIKYHGAEGIGNQMLQVEKRENTMALDRGRLGMSRSNKETKVAGEKGKEMRDGVEWVGRGRSLRPE